MRLLDIQKIKDGIQYGIGISLGFMLVALTSELLSFLIRLIAVGISAKSGMGVGPLQ